MYEEDQENVPFQMSYKNFQHLKVGLWKLVNQFVYIIYT